MERSVLRCRKNEETGSAKNCMKTNESRNRPAYVVKVGGPSEAPPAERVRIYNRALTAGEIDDLYKNNTAPSALSLTIY